MIPTFAFACVFYNEQVNFSFAATFSTFSLQFAMNGSRSYEEKQTRHEMRENEKLWTNETILLRDLCVSEYCIYDFVAFYSARLPSSVFHFFFAFSSVHKLFGRLIFILYVCIQTNIHKKIYLFLLLFFLTSWMKMRISLVVCVCALKKLMR